MSSKSSIQNVFSYGDVTYANGSGIIIGCVDGILTAKGIIAYNKEALLNNSSENIKIVGEGSLTFEDGKEEADVVKAFTKQQIKSGEVAWLLNGSTSTPAEGSNLSWYQKLVENGDDYPVLTSTGENTVYHGMTCNKKTDVYTNDNSIFGDDGAIPHEFKIADQPDANGLYGDVCVNCKENNESAKYINRFCEEDGRNIKLTVNPDGSYSTEETVTIADNAAYNSPVDFTAAKVVYTRNYLGADQWQAVYVPFEAKATDWTDNGITVASINNFHEYEKEDGSGYETVLEVKKYDCMSMTRKYDFIGIYTPQSGLGQDDASAVYVLNMDGGIQKISSSATLGAQRWYLTVSDRYGSNLPQESMSRSIRIDMVGEGATTGIEDIQVITTDETGGTHKTAFTICKVASSARSLLMASISKMVRNM